MQGSIYNFEASACSRNKKRYSLFCLPSVRCKNGWRKLLTASAYNQCNNKGEREPMHVQARKLLEATVPSSATTCATSSATTSAAGTLQQCATIDRGGANCLSPATVTQSFALRRWCRTAERSTRCRVTSMDMCSVRSVAY